MVGAHMNEFRLAGFALGLPVLRRPDQHRPHGVRIARAIEEIVGRGFRLAAGAFRIGESGGIGGGEIRDLVLRHEAGQRLGIRGAPAHDRRDLVGAGPFLVERDRARHLIAVIVGIDIELLAADAAVLVDPGKGVRDALSVGRSDVRRAAGIIGEMADRDLGLRRRRGAAEQQRQRNGAQKGFHGHRYVSSGSFVGVHCSRSRSNLNAKTGRVSSKS